MALAAVAAQMGIGYLGIVAAWVVVVKLRLDRSARFPMRRFLRLVVLPVGSFLLLTLLVFAVGTAFGRVPPAKPPRNSGWLSSLRLLATVGAFMALLSTAAAIIVAKPKREAIDWAFPKKILWIFLFVAIPSLVLTPILRVILPIEILRGAVTIFVGALGVAYLRTRQASPGIKTAPSHWARRVLRLRCTRKVYEQVIAPTLDDMDHEWMIAVAEGDRAQAVAVRLRGYWALIKALGLWGLLRALVSRSISK